MKQKTRFRTDLALAVLFPLSFLSGIGIHYAGHFQSHTAWHQWSIVHTLANIAFVTAAAMHIGHHRTWYKPLPNPRRRRNRITAALTLVFLSAAVSGVYLLAFTRGEGSRMGTVHYGTGIAFGILGIGHMVKRWKILKKGVSGRP